MRDARRSPAWRLALAPLLLTLACDTEPADPRIDLEERSLVGVVEGTDLALGVLLDEDEIAVYQCGGDETFETHTQWFRGVIGAGDDPNAFELEREGFTLIGTRSAEGIDGELVEPDGTRHPFRTDPVADEAEPGVYVADRDDLGAGLSIGVVVRQDGDALVAQGSSCTSTSPRQCEQVIILAPLTIESQSIVVQLDVDGAPQEVEVVRTLVAPEGV